MSDEWVEWPIKDAADRAALYGLCPQCGVPPVLHTFENGFESKFRLVCPQCGKDPYA